MSDIKNLIGKFLGKRIDKESSDWTKYKLTFKVDEKELNFSAFMPWKTKDGKCKKGTAPDKLEEGKWYKVGYTEYQSEEMQYPTKTIVGMYSTTEPTQTQLTNQSKPSTGIILPDDATLSKIITAYKSSVDDEVKSINHFIGTVLLTMNKDKLVKYIDVFNEHLKR